MLSCLRESGRVRLAQVMTPSGVFRYKEWKAPLADESRDTLIFTRPDVSRFRGGAGQAAGMLERQAFYRRVREKLDEDSSAAYVLLRCDIDRFKLYNDVFGTDAGDRLLSAIGAQISRTTPVGCLSGHIDADHFAVLLEDDPVDVRNWGDALEKWLRVPIQLPDLLQHRRLPYNGAGAGRSAHVRQGDAGPESVKKPLQQKSSHLPRGHAH